MADFFSSLEFRRYGLKQPEKAPSLETIKELQQSKEFEKLRVDRMVQGFFRYGDFRKKGNNYDRVSAIKQRLQQYEKTGSLELLVDIANFCMIEFEVGTHPKRHFKSSEETKKVEKL